MIRRLSGVALCCALFVFAGTARAQQTIFNVPSGDVLDRSKVYGEVDASLRPFAPRFSAFVPRVVVGLGGRAEAGLNLTGNIQPGADTTTLSPTFKWKVRSGSDGWEFLLGANLFFPVRNRAYDAGNYAYGTLVKTFDSKTRLSAGAYHFTPGVVAPGAHRAGGQFTAEHPVHSKITVAADWYTGKHSAGYASFGLISKPHPRVTLYAAYSVGNGRVRSGNHFFLLELGWNFN